LLKEIDPSILYISVIPSETSFNELEMEGKLAEEVLNISTWFIQSFRLDKLEL
jgi:hypothetical protein